MPRAFYIKTVGIDLFYVFQRNEVRFAVRFFPQAMNRVLIIYLPENSINTSVNINWKAPEDTRSSRGFRGLVVVLQK